MKNSSSIGKPRMDFHADNIYRRPRRNQKNSNSVLNDKSLRPRGKIIISKATKSSFIPKYRNRLSSIVTQKLIRANLLQEVGSDSSLKESSLLQQKGANSLMNGNISPKRADRKSKVSCLDGVQVKKKVTRGKETDGISESSLSESPRKSVGGDMSRRPINYNLLSFSSDNEADQSSDASEPDCAERNFSQRKDTNDEKWLESRQSVHEKIAELETPNENLNTHLRNYSLERIADELEFDKEDFNSNYDAVEELVEVINTFENFKIDFPKKTFVYQALVKSSDSQHNEGKESFDENKSNLENIVTAKLMGDIDLHLELENYLKAISTSDETGSSKVRTKNTLQQNHVNYTRGENTDCEGSNIIENKLRMSVSAVELNSSENSEKEKSKREDSVSGRLFNDVKTKSSSSFKSALSVCTPPSPPRDRNLENEFIVTLDRKMENFPMSQEFMDSKPTKDCARYTLPPCLEDSKNVKKIRSENDASILQQDIKVKGHIKRTIGEISLQPSQQDASLPVLQSVKFQNSLPTSLLRDTQEELQRNLYEKMSPLEPYCEGKLKPNTKSSVLFKNSFYTTSADSLRHNRISIERDSIQLCTNFSPMRLSSKYESDDRIEKNIDGQELSESVLSEKILINNNMSLDQSLKSQASLTTLNSNTENWSPSLQELIEIYNSVLKQNKKIRRCNIKRVKRSVSNYLISFIHNKIKEKIQKKELINYAKGRIGDSKLKIEEISNIYASESKSCEKKKISKVVEYVNRFQEVLSSSLSINQITQLNNIMAGVQESSLKSHTPAKIVTKKKTSPKIKKSMSDEKSSKNSVVSSKSKQKNFKPDRRVKKTKDVPETISFRANKIQKHNSFKTTANDKLKSVQEVKLPPSAELESVLKSYLTNSKTVGKDSQSGKSTIVTCEERKNKFLVNVKLCENKIIVKGMRQFKSEKALSKIPLLSEEETSDLIIESVSRQQIAKLKCSSKVKSPKLVSSNKNINNKKKFKKPEVKTAKQGINRYKTGDKHVKRESEESVSEEDVIRTKESVSHTLMERIASRGKIFQGEKPFINKFEYNHHLLMIQHPIEAIIESSESKISEKTVDNHNEFLLSQEESKFHIEGEMVKNENDIHSYKDVNLSLMKNSTLSNVGRGEEPGTPLPCETSYQTENCKRKNGTLLDVEKNFSRKKLVKFMKPANVTDKISVQSSNKSAPKKKKILVSRPLTTYVCYPYLQCIQGDKVTKNKKAGKNKKFENGSGSFSRASTVLKTDSSKKGQNKTKVLKNISKALPNLFKRSSERKEQKSKISKSNSNPSSPTVFEKKNENPKISEETIDYQVSNSKLEQDGQSTELYSYNINEFNNSSSLIEQNRSFISLTSSERSGEEPKNSGTYKHSASGSCSNRPRTENSAEYCSLKGFWNYDLKEDGECNSARVKRSFTSQNYSTNTDSYKRPTIVIHTRKEGNDDVSFPSLMVLSESFLKCYSNFALSRTKIKSLFKSHSDMKFYPGRVVDNPEEQTPFVTFVLTPKQKDEAGIPDYQIKVVTKPKDSNENLKNVIGQDDFHVNFGQITHEDSLRAIEQFIETLSESRKKACKLKEQANKTKNANLNIPKKLVESPTKPCPKKYKFTPCRRLQALFASKRKAYHECQKRLLANNIENSKNPDSEKKKNFKSINTMKVSQISSRNTYENHENEWESQRTNKNPKDSEMMKAEAHEERNIENNLALATTRSRCIYQKEPNNVSDDNTPNDEQNEINLLPEYLEDYKTGKNGVESFKNMKRVTEAIDEYHKTALNADSDATERYQHSCNSENDSERRMQMTKNAKKINSFGNIRNCKSVDSSGKLMKEINNNKKLKDQRIKTASHCIQSNADKPETIEENSYPFLGDGVNLQENSKLELSGQISDGERELLDSLLLKEENLGNLERKNSVYFDAEENEREENSDEQRSQEHSFTEWRSLRMDPSTKLRDTVPLLKKKGKNLVADKMENRWRRILSLLDDVSKEMEKSSEEESDDGKDNEGTAETKAMIPYSRKPESKISKVFNYLKRHTLERTKRFWNRVKTTNPTIDEERESLQSTSFLTQNSFRIVESFRIKSQHKKNSLISFANFNEVFSKLVDYLNAFKTKYNAEPEKVERKTKLDNSDSKSSSAWLELPVELYHTKSENLSGTTSTGFLIHQTNNVFNLPEALSEFPLKDDEPNDRNILQVLKQRIRKQRLLIQYLTNFPALPDIQLIKNNIIKKLGKLEKVVSILEKQL